MQAALPKDQRDANDAQDVAKMKERISIDTGN